MRYSTEALQAIAAYAWPGNIRELENRVSRAVIMARGRLIEPADLDLAPAEPAAEASPLREVRGRAERDALVEALSRHRGNISRAAQELKVSRPTFHGLLSKYKVDAKSFR
jgi:two-component system NtrC family response regulator